MSVRGALAAPPTAWPSAPDSAPRLACLVRESQRRVAFRLPPDDEADRRHERVTVSVVLRRLRE
jgi:hypothetical protein